MTSDRVAVLAAERGTETWIGRRETSPWSNHSAFQATPELIANIISDAIEASTFGAKDNREAFPAFVAADMTISMRKLRRGVYAGRVG